MVIFLKTCCFWCNITLIMPKAARTFKSLCKNKKRPEHRPNSYQRGYTRRWSRVRLIQLKKYPLCAICLLKGVTTIATEVDHIVPHRGNQTLMYDPDNFQSLCKPCHSRKTAKTDGGFGNETWYAPTVIKILTCQLLINRRLIGWYIYMEQHTYRQLRCYT